ncbi:hypothetical protein NO995_12835 [Aestuariibaculum sp. M13]|uniref:hypothetical protein n=1 Tax=Aestuariibaculum sp. M13 TaxID=2967132 RepID=UPI002159C6AA|nr:hypothetical protein [Aestuariibaculum sp. M13]MCR8668572.1 hypothetical protein [Aestuariibaculum sp. M13]
MLGIFFIYFIGKKFYELAGRYNQNQWLFAILSIVVYYASMVLFVIGLVIFDEFVFNWYIDWDNNSSISYLGIPVGLLTLYGFYKFLESRWKNNVVIIKDEIQDIGKSIDN